MPKRPRHAISACALVTRADDTVLLVKTRSRKGWEVPGGRVDVGETPLDGAIRETLEETGIHCRLTHMTGIYTNLTTGVVCFAFLGEYISGELTASAETPQVAWIARDAVLDHIDSPAMLARVGDMLTYDGQIVYRTYTKSPYETVSVVRIN